MFTDFLQVEPIIHLIARNGKLLAANCMVDKTKEGKIFITGFENNPWGEPVRSVIARNNVMRMRLSHYSMVA